MTSINKKVLVPCCTESEWLDNASLYTLNQIELLYLKYGYADLPDFSVSEIDFFIEWYCTA